MERRTGRARSAQAVPELLSDCPAGKNSSQFLLHCHFEIFNYSQNQGRKDQTHKQKALSCLDRQVGYFCQKPIPVRYCTCTALPWAGPRCSCGLATKQHWANRTCFCGLKEKQKLQVNKSILVRSQIQSCPGRKKHWYAQCKSQQVLKTSQAGSQQRTALRQQCYSHSHILALHAASFVWPFFCFRNNQDTKIFNWCYYSSLHWSRFLILEKYLSHCLLSQHEREGSCGTYCIVFLKKFSLFGSCISYSSSLLWHVLLTLDQHETITLRERRPLKKRSGGEERHLHECFFTEIQHSIKKDEVCLLKKSNPSG